MAQAGVKQELFAVPTALAKESGRYAVKTSSVDVAPEQAADAHVASASALRLLEINELSSEELRWIEARKSAPPPSEPVRGKTSAVFAKAGEDPTFEALRPFYREPTLERVQLQFEDRSLDPSHNPLALSSLLPAPRRAIGITGGLAIGVGVLALSSVAYLAAVASWGVHQRGTTVTLPARMAGVPHVVTLEPAPPPVVAVETPVRDEFAPADLVNDEVPWSSPTQPSQPAAAMAAPANPAAVSAPNPMSPVSRRRRLLAWRARTAEVRAASAASTLAAPGANAAAAQPSREQIRGGLESIRTAMQTCAGVLHGTSIARINISSTGRVASATIEGAFAGTPEGSCMARALRNAVFPRFSDPNLQVTYPFRL